MDIDVEGGADQQHALNLCLMHRCFVNVGKMCCQCRVQYGVRCPFADSMHVVCYARAGSSVQLRDYRACMLHGIMLACKSVVFMHAILCCFVNGVLHVYACFGSMYWKHGLHVFAVHQYGRAGEWR